jgi:hypothetical protein
VHGALLFDVAQLLLLALSAAVLGEEDGVGERVFAVIVSDGVGYGGVVEDGECCRGLGWGY